MRIVVVVYIRDSHKFCSAFMVLESAQQKKILSLLSFRDVLSLLVIAAKLIYARRDQMAHFLSLLHSNIDMYVWMAI